MRCVKCGTELEEGAKFCHYCGKKVEKTEDVNSEKDEINTLKDESIESLNKQTHSKKTYVNDIFKSTKNKDRDVSNNLKKKKVRFLQSKSLFEKISIILAIISLVMCLAAFITGRTVSGVIAVVQLLLIVVALLMEENIIKAPQKMIRVIIVLIASVMTMPYIFMVNQTYVNYEKYDWSDIVLKNEIPEPKSNYGMIYQNSNDALSMNVYKTNENDYKDYISETKKKGFTVEVENSDGLFNAFNKEGYKLSLLYLETNDEMDITLEAPIKLTTLKWPDSEIAKLLPLPKSNVGRIEKDDNTGFIAFVGKTNLKEFQDYVSLCSEKGFNIDVSNSDKHFSAKNSESYKLTVDYQGNNIILINLDEPKFDVEIEVECRENLAFSKYDVDVYIDDIYAGIITHGSSDSYQEILTKGVHTIKFVSTEDDSVTGEIEVDIVKSEKYEFKIHCTSLGINVETLKGTLVEKQEEPKKDDDNPREEKEEPKEDIILNISNCEELASLLALKDEFDPSIAAFASKYSGQKIEFDANTADVAPHGEFSTRFDYLILSGDYSTTSVSGPYFQFEDVNYSSLHLVGDNVPDSFGEGLNIHVIAIVDEYDANSGLFKLKPVEIRMR